MLYMVQAPQCSLNKAETQQTLVMPQDRLALDHSTRKCSAESFGVVKTVSAAAVPVYQEQLVDMPQLQTFEDIQDSTHFQEIEQLQ